MESNFVTISIDIPKDSDIYKAAEEFSKQNGDISVFSTTEKVLESCISFGLFPHISQSMELLGNSAAAHRAENDEK